MLLLIANVPYPKKSYVHSAYKKRHGTLGVAGGTTYKISDKREGGYRDNGWGSPIVT